MTFLDLIEEKGGEIAVVAGEKDRVRRQLRAFTSCKKDKLLLEVPFVSLVDYLWLLRAACQALSPLEASALLYLAAAVSDFYVPAGSLPEHKLQSSEGAPEVVLSLVPKMLTPLVHQWVPKAFVASFKLETDANLLVPKARQALAKYGHSLVIGNLLQTRKTEVQLVSSDKDDVEATKIELSATEIDEKVEIEIKIVGEVKKLHLNFCDKNKA